MYNHHPLKDVDVLDYPTARLLLGRDEPAIVTCFVNIYCNNIISEQKIYKNILFNVHWGGPKYTF